MHELGHAMGFIHEHSRPDRDKFVSIQLRNVKRGMEGQFQKFPASLINLHSVPYDYKSIMHYGPYVSLPVSISEADMKPELLIPPCSISQRTNCQP